MKKYRAKFNPDRKGVYAVSIVNEPAMDGNFIQFKKHEQVSFAKVDETKRRVMGLILEPNKEILRYNKEDDSEFTVYLEAQDIEDVAYNFQKKGYQNNSTVQHSGKAIEGVSFVETWIVENPKIDKSTNFGFEYPKGSWIGVMQLDNQEIWDEFVLSGKVKGFSIDAFMEFEEIKLNKVDMVDKNEGSLLELLKELPGKIALALKPKEVDAKKEDVKPLELAEDPKKEDEDEDEKVKLAEGDEDPAPDAPATLDIDAVLADLVAKIQEMIAPMQEEEVAMAKKLAELEVKLSAQSEELIQLGKAPASKSATKAPAQLDFSKMTEFEKYKYDRQNG